MSKACEGKKEREELSVVHLNTGISAASAPLRISRALRAVGVDSKIIALHSSMTEPTILVVKKTVKEKIVDKLLWYIVKYRMEKYQERNTNIPFSLGKSGTKLFNNLEIKNADIIHLHWINGNYISNKEIANLLSLNKPIVWTLHDSWPMTGGCHVRYGCQRFENDCGNCPHLKSKNAYDVSYEVLREKKKYYQSGIINIVSPSKWMAENVKKSSLFLMSKQIRIGNPIDCNIYKGNKEKKKDDNIMILFGANGGLETEYKGYQYLVEALEYLRVMNPQIAKKIEIRVFGSEVEELKGLETYKSDCLGYIYGDKAMAQVYASADLYVFPSTDDNLPGTVMESLACETPVVAFDTGGISDMVLHKKNGYLAQYKDARDLTEGILWVILNNEDNKLGINARNHILKEYDMEIIGEKYLEFYLNILKQN